MAKMRKIDEIFIHCTDSDDSLDIGFAEIDSWHRDRGWLSDSGVSCGYHYIIRRDGRVERGREDWERGAHVKGWNKRSLGIAWVGRNEISPKQFKTLLVLTRGLMNQYDVDIEDVLGHCEVDHHKTCPNLDMLKVRGNLLFTREDDMPEELKALIKK